MKVLTGKLMMGKIGNVARCSFMVFSLVPRPNPLTRKGSGVTSLNPWACGSVEAL